MKHNFSVKTALAAAGLLTAMISAPASAQWYAGLGVGSGKTSGINGTTAVGAVNVTTTGDASRTSWKLLGGYQFTPNWGLEAQYAGLGNRTITATAGAATGTGSASANQWSLAGTGTMPISNGFSLMGKLGFSRNQINGGNFCAGATCGNLGSSSRTDLLAGVGVGYSFNKNISLRAEYENFGKFTSNGGANGGAIKADNWAISLLYSF